jgi:hypothetical protein
VFDLLELVLVEVQQRLFTDRQGVWEGRSLTALENLLNLVGSQTKAEIHLDGLHPFNGLLVEVTIPVCKPTRAEELFLRDNSPIRMSTSPFLSGCSKYKP